MRVFLRAGKGRPRADAGSPDGNTPGGPSLTLAARPKKEKEIRRT